MEKAIENQVVANVQEVKTKEKNVVIVEEAIIKQVSSPATIQRVALDKGINPQEVFVRVIFETDGVEFGVSNKLRFLTKQGYVELIEAQKNKTPMRLAVDTVSEFFYIEKDISVDELFKEATPKKEPVKYNLAMLIK